MNVLLAAATSKEIAPLLDIYRKHPHKIKPELDIIITGPGLTAASYHLTRQISLRRPELVIIAGIAGSFDKKLRLGSVVIINKERIADEGVMENGKFLSVFDLDLVSSNDTPYKKGWLPNPNTSLLKKSKLKKINGVSVNQVTPKPVKGVGIESMEGAALHYVCLMEQVPFIQLRAISNYVGERNKKKWNLKDSIRNLNKELLLFLNSL